MVTRIDSARVSRIGSRPINEDATDMLELGAGLCAVVADGLGGHRGGEVAAHLAVEATLASFRSTPNATLENVASHIANAHEAVLERQRAEPALAQMRSTIVVLVADGEYAVWGHVGDSRLYYLQDGRIAARTKDHSVSQALVDAGEVAPHEQGLHEDRSRLLRSLGKEGEAGATVHPVERLHNDDGFLLCTDGFWEALSDTEIAADFCASSSAAGWIERLERRVARRLTAGKDNFTALAVRVSSPSLPPPPRRSSRDVADGVRTVMLSSAPGAGSTRKSRLVLAAVLVVLGALAAWTGPAAGRYLRGWLAPRPSPGQPHPKQGGAAEPPTPPRSATQP